MEEKPVAEVIPKPIYQSIPYKKVAAIISVSFLAIFFSGVFFIAYKSNASGSEKPSPSPAINFLDNNPSSRNQQVQGASTVNQPIGPVTPASPSATTTDTPSPTVTETPTPTSEPSSTDTPTPTKPENASTPTSTFTPTPPGSSPTPSPSISIVPSVSPTTTATVTP